MIGAIPQAAYPWHQISQPQNKEIWAELHHNPQIHAAFIDDAIKGKQQHEQDILENLLEEAYQHEIPDLIEAILFKSPIQPTFNLFSILYSHGSNQLLKTVWDRYTFKSIHQETLIHFLKMIPNFIDLQTIVNLMIQSGADIEKLVSDDSKYTLILAAEYVVVAQYWLTFLKEEDKKAEVLKQFSLSWQLLDKL